MAEPQHSTRSKESFAASVIPLFLGAGLLVAIWYFGIGLLREIEFLKKYETVIRSAQFWGSILFPVFAALGFVIDYVGTAKARKANKKVAEALDKIKAETPGLNIAEISAKDVAEYVKGSRITNEQLGRLVEQGKQRLLIDDKYLLNEISPLIVDYLQPLPRNAKRFLNRFKVNLLVAARRGLLTSEPKVTGKQIGKWLVLRERWPQLGHSLSAAPDEMKILEERSKNPAPSRPASPQPGPSSPPDLFMEAIKTLAPSYFGDEDLRRFIKEAPLLAAVMTRLANYDTEQSGPSRAATQSA